MPVRFVFSDTVVVLCNVKHNILSEKPAQQIDQIQSGKKKEVQC